MEHDPYSIPIDSILPLNSPESLTTFAGIPCRWSTDTYTFTVPPTPRWRIVMHRLHLCWLVTLGRRIRYFVSRIWHKRPWRKPTFGERMRAAIQEAIRRTEAEMRARQERP